MRTNLFYFLLLFLLFVPYSCTKNGTDGHHREFDCTSTNCKDSLDIQQFFSDASITLLEETEESRIGIATKVIVKDSIIFVLDRRMAKKVFLFEQGTGKFIRSIGEVGKSEKEYLFLTDCCVDEERNLIYLLCDYQKVLVYDYQGTFKSSHQFGLYSLYSIEYDNNQFYFFSTEPGKGNLVITDIDFNILKHHFVCNPENPLVALINPIQIRWDGGVNFVKYLDNKIYTVDENNEMQVLYEMDFGSNQIRPEDVAGMTYDVAKKFIYKSRGNISSFVENENFAFMLFFDTSECQIMTWDKKKDNYYVCPKEFIKDSKLGKFYSSLRFTAGHSFFTIIDANQVNPALVTNKGVNGGNNPAIYWLYE